MPPKKKKPAKAPREPKYELVPKVQSASAHRASLVPKKGGPSSMPQADIAEFEAGVGVLTSALFEQSAWIDLRAWPPKVAPLHASWTRSAARSRKGKWFVLSGFGPKGRWHRVYDRHGGRGKDLLLDGAKFELVYAGFLGERAAALPGPTYRDSDVPGLGVAPGLFIEVDGVLERGPDVPAGQGDITQTGFVKLGDGADLAIHAGRIGEWKGDGFAFTFKDELKPNYTSPSLCAIPYGDDGFITLARRKIVHVRRGKPIKTLFASKNTRVFPRMLMAGGRDWIAVSLESNALHRFDIVKKTMTRIDTTSLTEGGFDPSWYPPVAVAPCGIVAVVDQGFALARAGKRA